MCKVNKVYCYNPNHIPTFKWNYSAQRNTSCINAHQQYSVVWTIKGKYQLVNKLKLYRFASLAYDHWLQDAWVQMKVFFSFFTTSYTKCNMAFAHSRITDFFFLNFNTAVQILMGLLTNEENNLSCSYCPESMTITRHHRNIQTDPRDVLQNTTTLFLAFLLVSGPEKERLNRLKFWFYISWWNTCYLHVTSNSIDLRIEGFRSQPFYWDATL